MDLVVFGIGLLLALAAFVLFLVVAVGVVVAGPARWVKVSTVALVLCFFGSFALLTGPSSLVALGVSVVASVVLMAVAALAHRLPRRLVLGDASPADCPAHARHVVAGWTEELAAAGFASHGDRWQRWKTFGGEQRTFVRYLRHPEQPCWVELHALDRPVVVGRVVASRDRQGASLRTSDLQSDLELLGDPLTELHRHPRSTASRRLVELHLGHARAASRSFLVEADPAAASAELYDSWVARLLGQGELVAKGESWVGVPPRKVPGMVLKVLLAWFH